MRKQHENEFHCVCVCEREKERNKKTQDLIKKKRPGKYSLIHKQMAAGPGSEKDFLFSPPLSLSLSLSCGVMSHDLTKHESTGKCNK